MSYARAIAAACFLLLSPALWAADVQSLTKAARANDAPSQYALARHYAGKQNKKAKYWFERAAKQGHWQAQYRLAKMLLVDGKASTARRWMEKSANAGFAAAQYELGRLYQRGEGAAKSSDKAKYWFKKAARQGHVEAKIMLAPPKPITPKKRKLSPFEQNKEWAEEGDSMAQYRLGLYYKEGRGTDEDEEAAFKWFKRAAERDHAKAQYQLGYMYYQGMGVEADVDEALLWLKKAANQGSNAAKKLLPEVEEFSEPLRGIARKQLDTDSAEGQYRQGMRFLLGDGEEKNSRRAVSWLGKAAAGGHAEAMYQLANLTIAGDGVPQDVSTGLAWMERAATAGAPAAQTALKYLQKADYQLVLKAEDDQPQAQFETALLYLDSELEGDEEAGIQWLQRAARQDHPRAMYRLAGAYRHGEGVDQDFKRAFYWMREAARKGVAKAQFEVAQMYRDGEGTVASDVSANYWFQQAANKGHEQAKAQLAGCPYCE